MSLILPCALSDLLHGNPLNQLARYSGVSWHVLLYMLFKFSSPRIQRGIHPQGIVEHFAIYFKRYELDIPISSISMVLIQEIAVFTSSNTSVGSGGLFMHTLLKILVIVVIFTEHGLTIPFIPVLLSMSQETGAVFNHMRPLFFSPYFSYILYVKQTLLEYLNKRLWM